MVTAVSPIIAQILGRPGRRGKVRDVRRVVRQGFWVASALGVPFMIVSWQVRPIVIFFGQDPDLAVMAEAYMHALLWAFLPALWFVVLRCFVSAFGRTRAVLTVTLWGVAFNAVCGYALIFGHFGMPALGMLGAGISAALTHGSMAGLLLAHVLTDRQFRRYQLLGRLWRPDWSRFFEIFRIGLPIGGMWVLEGGVFAAALFLMGLIGTVEIAAHQIALQCAAIAFMVPLGISQAATVRVGLAAGAGSVPQIRRAGWTAIVHRHQLHGLDLPVVPVRRDRPGQSASSIPPIRRPRRLPRWRLGFWSSPASSNCSTAHNRSPPARCAG